VNRNDLVFLKAIWHKMRYVWPGSAKIAGNRVHCSSVDFCSAKISSANIFLITPTFMQCMWLYRVAQKKVSHYRESSWNRI